MLGNACSACQKWARLRFALPESLSAGPDWLIIVVVGVLLIPTAWARQRDKDNLNKFLGYLLSSIVTVDMIWSLGLPKVAALPAHQQSPKELLRSAAALWITNILVFASWYWRLDAGGPRERELRGVHTDGAFLFPQMTLDQQAKRDMGEQCWSPGFVDYLFSRLQHQHRIFTNGLSRTISVGQTAYDGSIAHFLDNGGSVGSSRRKYSLAASQRKPHFGSAAFASPVGQGSAADRKNAV